MAADRHEPACVTEKLMTMIGAAAAPFSAMSDLGPMRVRVFGTAEGELGMIRRLDTETKPEKEHAMRMVKQSTWYAYGQAWTKLTYRI